jgi:hypothetical protein
VCVCVPDAVKDWASVPNKTHVLAKILEKNVKLQDNKYTNHKEPCSYATVVKRK